MDRRPDGATARAHGLRECGRDRRGADAGGPRQPRPALDAPVRVGRHYLRLLHGGPESPRTSCSGRPVHGGQRVLHRVL